METFNRKDHWDNIYTQKSFQEVSWYQKSPEVSLSVIGNCNLPKDAKIIDVGAGESFFVDGLIELAYTNITVLDIATKAIQKTRERLGEKAQNVNWIVKDILDFSSPHTFDFWHDRAVFHFLTTQEEIQQYRKLVSTSISIGAYLCIGTFSDKGPNKCSGIEVTQYTQEKMTQLFSPYFQLMEAFQHTHTTPFDTNQDFLFCVFKRIEE
jgi:hypothetical protein